MPKIAAPTVKEHRENVLAALVDAAEQLLREGGGLTAAAVSSQAGIARNSIYRYVDSVDDLRGHVLARHLPRWQAKVQQTVDTATDPRERILLWSRANLEQAAGSGHGWLMEVARGVPLSEHTETALDQVHGRARDSLREAWQALAGDRADLGVDLTRALVDAGFRRLDAGDGLDEVSPYVVGTVSASIDVVTGR